MADSAHRSSGASIRQSDDEGEEEMLYELDEQQTRDEKNASHALNLEWTIGFNYKLVNGVINLIDDDRKKIFFISGNTGVIYDYKESSRRQTLLQGHCNEIMCCAYCRELDILVTADRGPSSLLVVWDVKTGTPRHSIFDPHPNGVQSLDITNDGQTIVTLSLEPREGNKRDIQTVKIWHFDNGLDTGPNYREVMSARIDRVIAKNDKHDHATFFDYQKYVNIKKWKNSFEEFATTGDEKVFFWKVDQSAGYQLKGYLPPNNIISKRGKRAGKDDQTGKTKRRKGYLPPGKIFSKRDDKEDKADKDDKKDRADKDKMKKERDEDERNNELQKAFTQTVFIPETTQAVTGTNDGQLVVWDISLILEDMTDPDQRREIKTINLLNVSGKNEERKIGISVLMSCPDLLVIGATNGHVRFYDYQFRIVAWFENDKIGEVTSISLCHKKKQYRAIDQKQAGSTNDHYFDCPDFIVVDKNAKIVEMKAAMFNETTSLKDTGDVKKGLESNPVDQNGNRILVLESIPGRVNAISSRPDSTQIAISCDNSSFIYQWDFAKKEYQLSRIDTFAPSSTAGSPVERPTTLQYSPDGEWLVVATTLKNLHCCRVKKDFKWQKNILAISLKKTVKGLYITFAESSDYFAIIDDHSCVSLYRLQTEKSGDSEWVFNGRLKSHMSDVNDVCFVEMFENGQNMRLMLYSVGDDKYLVEYDVKASTIDNLAHSEPFKIEHEVVPTSCVWYPVNHLKEPILMIATTDYKIKLWNVKGPTKVCVATLLGPTYGGPINKMLYLRRKEEDHFKYVAYTTAEKIAGVIKLPMDGNPNKTMGLIAHPNRISSMTATSDGKFLFSSGYDDIGIVNMWFVNYAAIDEQDKMAAGDGNPLDVYPNLLEGGKDGQIFRDLKDFFYFAQIDSNKGNPTKAKKLDGKIPYDQVPNLMRALGYYPTNQEAQNMMNEVLYSKRHLGDKVEENLVLDTFVKLFINHRPVYGLTHNLIKQMVTSLANREGKYSREQFIKDMTTRGDKFTNEELKRYLGVLYGEGEPSEILPQQIDSEFLIEKLLGMEDDNEDEPAEFVPDHSN